jgi:hypothetical protein
MSIIYSVVKPFDPSCGEKWQAYIKWSGLTQLSEVISLDGLLCPRAFDEFTEEDWQHSVQADFGCQFFRDVDYAVKKAAGRGDVIILGLIENPTESEEFSLNDPRFVFSGYDLFGCCGTVSALVNCGGFPKAFASTELSDCGLLREYPRAITVQRLLKSEYPNEPHANCNVWAIWKMSF